MNTLGHGQKPQTDDTLPAWMGLPVIEQARGHNLSMGVLFATGARYLVGVGEAVRFGVPARSKASMLLNLPEKSGYGSRADAVGRQSGSFTVNYSKRNGDDTKWGSWNRTACFRSSMGRTTAQAVRVTLTGKRENPGSTPGAYFNLVAQEKSAATGAESRGSRRQTIHGKSVKGSVTRYERLGASPKALRSEDRGADFLEAIC